MNLTVGITGGIASGKSTVSNYIRKKGYKIIDADILSKEIMEYGQEGYAKVKEAFPEAFERNTLNRSKLADIIFHDDYKKDILNSITHPIIKKKIIDEIKRNSGIVFIDVPLLFEAHYDDLCDKIIVVYVDRQNQIKRLMARDNIDENYAIKKIDSQMSLDEKVLKADMVIDNNKDENSLLKNIDEVLEVIINGKNLSNK